MNTKPFRIMSLAGMLILGASSATHGVTISIPDAVVPVGVASVDIPVIITGGEALTDMVFFVQVGNGGTVTGNLAVPQVLAFDLNESIWQDAPGGFTTWSTYGPPEEIPDLNLNLDLANETVSAEGTLLTITMDTSNMSENDYYPLLLTTFFGDKTDVQGSNGPLNAVLINGSISVPEPHTTTLLLLGLSCLAFSVRSRRFSKDEA